MTLNDVISKADRLAPNMIDPDVKTGWLSTLDGRLAVEDGAEEIPSYEYGRDGGTELYLPHPFDGAYVFYVEAMIHYHNHDYGEYNNAVVQYTEQIEAYRASRAVSTAFRNFFM